MESSGTPGRFLRRPVPSSDASIKRQRIGSAGGTGGVVLAAMGMLPRQARDVLEVAPREGSYGVADCDKDTVIAWVRSGDQLLLWQQTRGKRPPAKCTRLALPADVAGADALMLAAFRFAGEADVGVILATERGDVMCWPSIESAAVPVRECVLVRDGFSLTTLESVEAPVGVVCVAGSSDGALTMLWVSAEDLCLRKKSLFVPSSDDAEPGIASKVSRWLGFGAGPGAAAETGGPAVAAATLASLTTGEVGPVVDVTCAVHADKVLAFALYGSGQLLRFDLEPERATAACAWRCLEVHKWAREKVGRQNTVHLRHVAWAGGEAHQARLVVFAEGDDNLTLLELRNVCSAQEPYLGRASAALELDGHAPSCAVYADEGGSVSLVAFEQGAQFVVHASRDLGAWQRECVPGVTTGWFALGQMRARGGQQLHAAVLNATCVLAVQFEVGVSVSASSLAALASAPASGESRLAASRGGGVQGGASASREMQLAASHRSQPSPMPAIARPTLSSGVAGTGPALDRAEAGQVLGRMVRAFFQEVAQGRSGLAVAREDNKWAALMATPAEALEEAICAVAEKELNRSPNQRWADTFGSSGGADGGGGGTGGNRSRGGDAGFVPELVHRHLQSKASRFGAPDGLVGFLGKTGILGRLAPSTVAALRGYVHKLEACFELCELHERSTNAMAQLLSARMREVVFTRLASKSRQGFDEESFEKQLEHAGLSVADLFYANVTDVHALLSELTDASVKQARSSGRLLDGVAETNEVFLAVLRHCDPSAVCDLSDLGAHDELGWQDADTVAEALAAQIEANEDLLRDQSDWASHFKRLAGQLHDLVDLRLESLRRVRGGRLEQEEIEPLVAAFLPAQSSSSAGGARTEHREEVLLSHVQLARSLCEKYVCLNGLFRVGEMVLRRRGENLVHEYAHRGAISRLEMRDAGDNYVELLNSVGVPLALGLSNRWTCKRWSQPGAETVRHGICHESGSAWLSLSDQREWYVRQELADPTENELFEVIACEGEDRLVRIQGWDQRSCLAVSPSGDEFSTVCDVEEWSKLPGVILKEYLAQRNGHRILELAEAGLLDKEVSEFLRESSEDEPLAHELQWLDQLRRKEFVAAAETLHQGPPGASAALDEEASFRHSLAKLALHAA